MGTPVIQIEGLGKRYRLGEHHGEGTDLRESAARLLARVRHRTPPTRSEFWSLRNISLQVDEGDVIGIVGANGAGKSTLLKVINGITAPTEGECRTRGRIGSLLEVGTGFHRELTGRENTFLNGAILGMTRREVAARLDEIVEFAGLEAFMDTPVKRYSSGMYLRLGFAIAAHLEADILLVDEVLAVGDADFQRKCLGKMSEIGQSGRTVLFISHSMESVARLCTKAVWLEKGEMRAVGGTDDVIDQYTRSTTVDIAETRMDRDHSQHAQVTALSVVDETGATLTTLNTWSSAFVQVVLEVGERSPGLDVGLRVSTASGVDIFDEFLLRNHDLDLGEPGTHRLRMTLPPILTPGEYTLGVWLGTTYEEIERHEHAVAFRVEGADRGSTSLVANLGLEWALADSDPPLR